MSHHEGGHFHIFAHHGGADHAAVHSGGQGAAPPAVTPQPPQHAAYSHPGAPQYTPNVPAHSQPNHWSSAPFQHKHEVHHGLFGSRTASGQVHAPHTAGEIASAISQYPPHIQAAAAQHVRALDTGRDLAKSNCTGNKKAVLIGCNYFKSPNELHGCINDVKNVKQLITSKFGFSDDAEHMLILTDDQTDPAHIPNRANIMKALHWLVAGAQPHDSLFLHYSGHGATTPDKGPVFDSPNGMDDTLVPIDYQTAGMILDKELHETLVKPLPEACRLTFIADCCHSGSVLDLPYTYVLDGGAGQALAAQQQGGSRDLGSLMAMGQQMLGGGSAGGASSTPGITPVDNRQTLIAHALAAGKAFIAHDSATALHELLAAATEHFSAPGGNPMIAGLLQQFSGGGGFLGAIAQQNQGQPGMLGQVTGMFAQITGGQQGGDDGDTSNTTAPQQAYAPQYAAPSPATPLQTPAHGQSSGHLESQLKPEAVQVRTTLADVVQISGCRNDQTSADAFIAGQPSGALSYAFIKSINDQGMEQTYSELLLNVRTVLQQGKYSQVPQLSTGAITENLDVPFFM